MIIGEDSVEKAVQALGNFRRWSPYKYSGRWFLAKINEDVFAFRTRKPLLVRASKAGLKEIEITQFGK